MTSLADAGSATIDSDAQTFVNRARTGTLTIAHVDEAIARGIDIDTESSDYHMTALQYVIYHHTHYDATPGIGIITYPEPFNVGGEYSLDTDSMYEYTEDADDGLARYLLVHGADPNKQTGPRARAAVHYAALTDTDNLLRLICHGGNVNLQDGEGNTPLHWLINNPSLEDQIRILKFITYTCAVDFTIRNNAGRTAMEEAEHQVSFVFAAFLRDFQAGYRPCQALHTAAEFGVLTKQMVQQAVAAGIAIEDVYDHKTLLGFVVSGDGAPKYDTQSDADSVVVALLQAGAAGDNINCAMLPFLTAAWCGHPDNLRRMIEYGVNVNVADHKGRTALMTLANAEDHHLECLEELAKAPEIDYTLRNHRGETAEDVARAKGQPELAEAIKVYREQQERWSRERTTWLDVTSSSYAHELAARLLWDKYHARQTQQPRNE
jgi:ankyrin repeat protein